MAYAQCHGWLGANLPSHSHVPASSNVASAIGVLDGTLAAQAAIAAPGIVNHYDVDVLAEGIGDNAQAVTRFVLVTRTTRARADRRRQDLPDRRAPARLTRVRSSRCSSSSPPAALNLSLIESRPIGDELGRYRS